MKVSCSKFYGCQEEYNPKDCTESMETTIVCNVEELEKLVDFFSKELELINNYIEKIKSGDIASDGEPKYCHSHFRDWDKKWKKGSPDLIIYTVITPEDRKGV